MEVQDLTPVQKNSYPAKNNRNRTHRIKLPTTDFHGLKEPEMNTDSQPQKTAYSVRKFV
jgi:hypothetical protein